MRYLPGDVPWGTKVYVNGRLVSQVVMADTKKGLARRYRDGLPVDRWRKRILTETLRGEVRLEFPGEGQ